MEKAEQQILQGCLRGNAQAQRQLYEKYKVPMFRLCLRYARGRTEAEDMLQEGFIRVFADLKQYRGEGPLGGWIRTVILRVALQHVRRKPAFEWEQIDEQMEQTEASEEIMGRLGVQALTAMIQRLPLGYRTVFNLYVIEGYAHREIAGLLGIAENTSKSQLSKAKAMLRRMLEKNIVN